ncbi:MAG: DUF547 domain-containing protein [Deltaproteobacteria bacterium]|nr:DUF547 domain-containing protein [Deltaproteobacteria bacterium]
MNYPSDAAVDHAPWQTLLTQYVDTNGRVAYRDLQAKDATTFAQYLMTLTQARLDGLSEAEEKALWINAYNAVIVSGILQGYTAENILKRKRLFSWYALPIAGKDRTPDEIEHEILRKKFRDPRIHFAIVCASTSCPKLRAEAYVAERLEQQLDDAARQFVNDPARNRIEQQQIALSLIFKWFAQDFIEHAGSVANFLHRFVTDDKKGIVERLSGDPEYFTYNWTLNAQEGQRIP